MTLDTLSRYPVESPSPSKKRGAAKGSAAGDDAPPLAPSSAKAGDAPFPRPANLNIPVLPLDTQVQDFDREIRAAVGRATGSLSVASALLAGIDWAVNLLASPGKRAELQLLALKQARQLAKYAGECLLAGPSVSTCCTSGGHNAGIVNPPGHPRRHYQLLKSATGEHRLDPDEWLTAAPEKQGSWWPAWHEWLRAHSGAPVKPPRIGMPGAGHLDDAPGRYVLEK